MADIKPYSNARFAKVSKEILDKNYRTNLGLHAQKLLYGLASCLDDTQDMFPEWYIPIDGLFKYLGLSEKNGDRYEAVRNAIMEVAENPLQYRINDKKWGVWSWLSMAKFDAEESNFVTVKLGNDVKPYLLGLKEYCRLEARYYVNLSSNYAMWLYPLLRNVANKKQSCLILTLKEIKELTYNEKTKAYNPEKNRNANADLLKWVVGIEKKRGSKYYTPIQSKNSKGKKVYTGAVLEINEKTDLLVNCDVIKNSRSIHAVKFDVQFKPDTYQGKRKAIRKAHRTDYKTTTKQAVISDILEGKLEGAVKMETVEMMAKEQGKSVHVLLREMGYFQHGKNAIKI